MPTRDVVGKTVGVINHWTTTYRARLANICNLLQTKKQAGNCAVRQSRLPALNLMLVHVLTLWTTGAVLYLGSTKQVFAPAFAPSINAKLNAMQFVARLYEYVQSLSIGYMVLDHARFEMCAKDGLPLALSAVAFQLTTPQYLLSKAYWTVTWDAVRSTKLWRIWVCLLMGTAVVLTALVGPSSAVLLVPQLAWSSVSHPFSGTEGPSFLVGTYDKLYPSYVNESWIPNDCDPSFANVSHYCPNAFMTGIGDWASAWYIRHEQPNFTVSSTLSSTRFLTASTPDIEAGWSGATVPMLNMARHLGDIWEYARRSGFRLGNAVPQPRVSVTFADGRPVQKPLVQVQCSEPVDIRGTNETTLSFPSNRIVAVPEKTAFTAYPRNLTINTQKWISRQHVQVKFVTLETGDDPVLAAVVGFSFTDWNPSNSSEVVRALFSCTIDSSWIQTSMAFEPFSSGVKMSTNSNPGDLKSGTFQSSKHLSVDLSYANALNSKLANYAIDNTPFTVFEYSLRYFYYDSNGLVSKVSWGNLWPWMVSTVISTQMAEALSKIEGGSDAITWINDQKNSSKPKRAWNIGQSYDYDNYWGSRDLGRALFQSPEHARSRPDSFIEIKWTVQQYVYAWGFQETTVHLALVIVGLHTLLVLYHLAMIFCWNWQWTEWTDLLDFLALAMRSPPPRCLETASAGIQELSTYKELVRIREDGLDGNDIALAVGTFTANRTDTSQSMKLVPGKRYGVITTAHATQNIHHRPAKATP